jgi:thermostable 8-oxoguanine DNA glycosylase
MDMEQTLPANVTNHYRNHRDTYNQIGATLFKTRKRFLESSYSEKIVMLQKSHSFAVISVQTPVDIHEKAFAELWRDHDKGRPIEWNIDDALDSVNYKNNKKEYIMHSINHGNLWARVAEMLEDNNINEAHKFILDNMKGVGPAKSPFVLSMLGFEEKMCIDTNIVNAFDLDGHVSTVVVEKYDNICQSLRDKMPTLRDMTTPFLFQWVTFDYQRGNISTHDVFYETL